MTLLSDTGIWELQKEHSDLIVPFRMSKLQPCSIDLHFGMDKGVIVPPVKDNCNLQCKLGRIVVPPNELVLISTEEKVHIPNGYMGRVEGVSSLARIGLLIHITSGFIDSNFEGNITLEVINFNKYPIILEDGCRICQLAIEKLDSVNETEYSHKRNHYQNQDKTTPSRYEDMFVGSSYVIKKE